LQISSEKIMKTIDLEAREDNASQRRSSTDANAAPPPRPALRLVRETVRSEVPDPDAPPPPKGTDRNV
jgi:hypothetical protein